jgi:YidC/Oxa1 family membrane protein insertase
MWDTLITNPMVNTLLWIYSVLSQAFGSAHMFGVAIILFTLLIRLITHPLTVKQMKSSQAMQEMQKDPEWLEIQKKHKGDKEKLQREQMRIYKEKGFNPLAPCLPSLIQFPIMIGLYQAITRALAVTPGQLLDFARHIYSFIPASDLLPINSRFLWMDLSQPERVTIFGFGVPVLAVLVVISTFLQSRLMTPPSQPGDQGAAMTQTMNMTMPLFMGYIAYLYSSGLALYFLVGNILGIIQYSAMGKVNWRNLLPGRKAAAPQLTAAKPAVKESRKVLPREGKKERKSS